MSFTRWCRHLLITLLLPAAVLPAYAQAELVFSDAWIREAPPAASVLAGYLVISNPTAAAVTVTGVSGADFSSVEIHRTVIEDGMARMQSAGQLEIPAGGKFTLAPGGYHLMLFNPRRPLTSGDNVKLLLHVRNGACVGVTLPVRRAGIDDLQ